MSRDDLVGEDDPLYAELWASQMLGTFYKVPLPLHVRDEFERSMTAGLLEAIDEAAGENQMAVLHFARFRYPGREPHTVIALYDVNMGGIFQRLFRRLRPNVT